MIAKPGLWLFGAALSYATALLGHAWLVTALQPIALRRAFDTAAALVWGAVLLGVIARRQPAWPAAYWRLSLLGVGLALAVLGLWLVHRRLALDDLAATLLGLAIAAILPRVLPDRIVWRWLGQDRRR
jgi:hypothetical protein